MKQQFRRIKVFIYEYRIYIITAFIIFLVTIFSSTIDNIKTLSKIEEGNSAVEEKKEELQRRFNLLEQQEGDDLRLFFDEKETRVTSRKVKNGEEVIDVRGVERDFDRDKVFSREDEAFRVIK